jgi:alpha-D-xyloside xylohydrolase
MKFTNGQWLLQPGVTAHYPAEARALHREGDALVVHAPSRPIRHRGDTLGGPLLTLRYDSPLEGVLRVRIEHFTGGPQTGPHLPLEPLPPPPVDIAIRETEAVLRSGPASVHLKRGEGWEVTFCQGGKPATRSASRGIGYIERADGARFVHEQLTLGVGECVYGLGERFTAFVKNGQTVETENKDGGTGSDQAYKAVPFYLTNRGYGILVNSTGHVSFEVASEKVSRVQFSLPGECLEYFFIAGPTPKDVLRRLTALTGRPALPPPWSFGLWLTTSFTTSYDEGTVTQFIEGMASRNLPLHVFHFDCFWMREFDWCNFEWDPAVFPDPRGMLARLKARGLRICVWINPYIGQRSALFEEGRRKGYFLRRPDGGVWQTDLWQPGMAIVDFTHPAARDWYRGHLRRLLDMGVDCFKTDFGERIPDTGVVYHDGSDPALMHNAYAVVYNEAVFSLLEEVRGKGEAVVFARSAHAGGQKFPVHWGGDCWSTFESMAESLRGGLSLAASGFGFWSHDIGGFEGTAPAAVYKRWVAFGLLSSHSRLHGSSSYRVPWTFDEEACDVLRFFTQLKCRLMPYLFQAGVTAHREGIPVLRPMVVEFPDDPACDTLDRQYLLGDRLLVAPVFDPEGRTDVYLPAGRWTHLLTGEVHEGGRWHRFTDGFLSLPLFVRDNTVLPLGAVTTRPDYAFAEGITFHLYGVSGHARAEIPDAAGNLTAALDARREGDRLTLDLSGQAPGWSAVLAGTPAVFDLDGGTSAHTPEGLRFTPNPGSRRITVRLPA